jgi:hypothetical protein
MKRKSIFILGLCFAITCLLMAFIYITSPLNEPLFRAEFIRDFKKIEIEKLKEYDLKVNSFYFAGSDSNRIFLGNYSTPYWVTIYDKQLEKSERIELAVEEIDTLLNPGYFKLHVTPPFFYLTHGSVPVILQGNINDWRASKIKTKTAEYFDQAVPIKPNSFILRSYIESDSTYALAKKISSDSSSFSIAKNLLEAQQDGLFSLDGHLHYDKSINKLIYLYVYRNQYLIMDTSLNLINKGATIDSFKTAHIDVTHIKSSNSYMLSKPPIQVNRRSATDKGLLYIESNLLSRNEDEKKFKNGSTFDIYDIKESKYLYSFYIPKYKDLILTTFIVDGEYLYAIYYDHLIYYKINLIKNDKNSATL